MKSPVEFDDELPTIGTTILATAIVHAGIRQRWCCLTFLSQLIFMTMVQYPLDSLSFSLPLLFTFCIFSLIGRLSLDNQQRGVVIKYDDSKDKFYPTDLVVE